jgi:hypothetical protein
MRRSNTLRATRKAKSCAPDLFDWARQNELNTTPAIRAISRRAGVSPALALTLAELAGLTREARHG